MLLGSTAHPQRMFNYSSPIAENTSKDRFPSVKKKKHDKTTDNNKTLQNMGIYFIIYVEKIKLPITKCQCQCITTTVFHDRSLNALINNNSRRTSCKMLGRLI